MEAAPRTCGAGLITPFPPAGERGRARDSLEGTRRVRRESGRCPNPPLLPRPAASLLLATL